MNARSTNNNTITVISNTPPIAPPTAPPTAVSDDDESLSTI